MSDYDLSQTGGRFLAASPCGSCGSSGHLTGNCPRPRSFGGGSAVTADRQTLGEVAINEGVVLVRISESLMDELHIGVGPVFIRVAPVEGHWPLADLIVKEAFAVLERERDSLEENLARVQRHLQHAVTEKKGQA